MKHNHRIKFTHILWTLIISGVILTAFLLLMQSGQVVQAQTPVDIHQLTGVIVPRQSSQQEPDIVKAILLSGNSVNGEGVSGGSSTVIYEGAIHLPVGRDASLLALSPPIPGGADLVVSMDTDRVWGITSAGETVTVSVNGTQMGAALADNNGFFWTTLYNSSGAKPSLTDSDVVSVYHNGALIATSTLHGITGDIDVDDDDVTGSINGVSSITVTVYTGWGEPNMTAYSQTTTTDVNGEFGVDFTGNWDFIADDRAQVVYTENGIEVHQRFYANRLIVQPWPFDLALGNTLPGAAITVTVYDSDGTSVLLTKYGSASDDQGGAYSIEELNLELNDIVVVEIDGAATMTRTVDVLQVFVDAENDRITGNAPPLASLTCRTSLLIENGYQLTTTETTADAAGLYTVTLAGSVDIMPGQWAGCYIHDSEGDDLALWEPAYGLVIVDQTWNSVIGRAMAPSGPLAEGRIVTLELESQISGTVMVTTEMGWGGWFEFFEEDYGLPDIQAGDSVTVESQGYVWQGVVNVEDISVEYDVENDQLTGEVQTPSNRVELSGSYWESLSSRDLYPVGGYFDSVVTATSPFTSETSGFDVRNGSEFNVDHRTADSMVDRISAKTDNVRFWQQYNGVIGTFPPADTAFTITLREGGGTIKQEITGNSWGPVGDAGWMDFGEQQAEPGDYIEIESESGLNQVLNVPEPISVQFDDGADVISGTGPANTLLLLDVDEQGKGYVPIDENGDFVVVVDQLQQVDGDGDFRNGQNVMICYLVLEGSQICYSFSWPDIVIDVNYGHQWIEIQTVPDETVYITLTDSGSSVKATMSGDSDGGGGFRSYEWDWNPEQPNIEPGDIVTVTVAGMEEAVNQIGEIYGDIDVVNDLVTGTLNAPWFSPMTLTVACEVWVDAGPPGFEIEGVEVNDGQFVCDYSEVGYDLRPEDEVGLRYREPDDDSVINVFRSPWMRVNYGHDWVGGSYPAGHTFWITQTQGGVPQAYAMIDSTYGGGWGGAGFETSEDNWSPAQPDLQIGDVIILTSDDGYTNTILVGDISGNLNIDTDFISGTISAPWFEPLPMNLICAVWVDQGPQIEQEIVVANGYEYACDFSGEMDIQIGHQVAVMYVEPDDTDYVINVFEEPAPDVEVSKYVEGTPSAGGRMSYWVEYWNHGESEALGVTITDTLPLSTTYVVDTGAFAVMTTVNEVIWDLGTLEPQSYGRFKLVLDIDPAASGWLDNHIEITTLDDNNPDNNQFDDSVELQPTDVNLSINKWIHHAEPAPGYSFKYILQYNNEGSTGSGQVTLTDTLPIPTMYMDFYSQDSLWYLLSNNGVEVVFRHPGLPSESGDQIELTLHLSDTINIDEGITNSVEIKTTNETGDIGNNFFEHFGQVRDPNMNIGLHKGYSHGTTVAGHDITYYVNYQNHSNVPANNVLMTDTLPSGTTFVTSTTEVWNGNDWEAIPIQPYAISTDEVVFDLGTLEPATEGSIHITLHIDNSVSAGTVLTNNAEISSLGPNDYDEDYLEDNIFSTSVIVREAGMNLMIVKHDRSSWEGGTPPMIRYDFQVYNVGTVPVSNIEIVDTYPDVTTFAYAELWWGGNIQFQFDENTHQASWTSDETLWPGESFGGQLTVELDQSANRGSIFTNTIEVIPLTGDIYPLDNFDYEVLTTGPDLYVEKTVNSDWVEPGELVTYTLHFGNNARRGEDWTQASTTLTDTLPPGMTYVTSTIRWCDGPGCPYITPGIDGNQLIFNLGQMGDGSWNEISLTVLVDSQAEGGDTFGNLVEYYSDSPVDDPEANYANNTDSVSVTVYDPVFDVSKAFETTTIAGTQVTYTLSVANTGNEDGTGVQLSDTLPAGLLYVGGNGSYSAGMVTWSLGTVTASGGTGSGWFNATLPCTLDTIVNDDYGVSSSDQGVSSDPGSAVNFTVIEPNVQAWYQQSAALVEPGATVYFTGTMATDGAGFSGYTWFFNDLSEAFPGQYVSRTFDSEGIFTATFAVTGTCGWLAGAQTTVTVVQDEFFVYLPYVVRNY